MLILSLFPGIDLLGRGFEEYGFCVVQSGDIILGKDIRHFRGLKNKFDGIVGGSPCQDFSLARRSPPTGYGLEMLNEFKRVVLECSPEWFLLENVPNVPKISIEGYQMQRFFGEFEISDYQNACDIADKIEIVGQYYSGYKRRAFVYAMLALFKNNNFEFTEIVQKLKIQPTAMVDCTTSQQYVTLIEEIYNYRRREKVNLRY